jgi:valyl-tRNA synthetase
LEKTQKDLKYNEEFLASVIKKLSNEKFVNSAPVAVVEQECKKQKDTEEKIALLKAQIKQLI